MSDFILLYTTMRPGSSETDDAFMAPVYIESSILYDDEGLESTENGLPGIGYSRSSIQLSGISDTGYPTYDGDDISTNHLSRPGDTLDNPITIDISDHDNNVYPGSYSGDSIDNPIELDIASVYTRGPGSTHESPVQVENLVDGRSRQDHYAAAIHFAMHAAMNIFIDVSWADLSNQPEPPKCPFCRKTIPGKYIDTEEASQEVEGHFFFTKCLEQEQCFLNGYAIEGIRMILP